MADDLRSSLLGAGDAGEDAGSSGEGRHESSGALAAAQTRSQTDWGPADRRLSRGSTLPNEGGARIGDGPERDGLQGDGEWRLGTIGRYSSNRATLRQHSLSESIMSDQMSSMSLAEHEYLVDSQTAREGCLRATETRTSQTFLCIAVALISGTYLSFGIYAERLKLTGDFTQSEVATIGYMLDLGVFGFRPLLGMLFDSIGPRSAFWICGALGGTGYLMFSEGVRAEPKTDLHSVAFLSFSMVLVGIAGSLGYMASLFTCISNYSPKGRSVAVALCSSGMALSPLVVAVTYRYIFDTNSDFSNFFLLWSLLMYSLYCLAALLANANGFKPKKIRWMTAMHTYASLLSNRTFWMMAGPFALVQGVGLMVVNNASPFARSLSASREDYQHEVIHSENITFYLIIIYAFSGISGRWIVGQAIMRSSRPSGMYLPAACIVLALGLLLFAIDPSISMLYVLFGATGLSVGMQWTVCITLLKMFAPVESFGQAFGVMCCLPAFSSIALNYMAGELYEENGSVQSDGSTVCYGSQCFETAVWVGFGVSLLAAACSYKLIAFSREEYEREAKEMNDAFSTLDNAPQFHRNEYQRQHNSTASSTAYAANGTVGE